MPVVRRLSAADSRRVPWRNGRGVTEELAVGPAGASFERGDFDWRISKAGVTEPGPFSAFAGFERVLVVTSGGGLDLVHGDAAPPARVTPFAPYRFSGDWPTSATLVDGAVTDFNVITRRGAVAADVRVLRVGAGRVERCDVAGDEVFVHLLTGGVAVRSGATTIGLSPGESAWWTDGSRDDETLEFAATAEACIAILTTIART